MDVRAEHEAKRILGERGYGHLWQQVVQFDARRAGVMTVGI